MTTIVDRELLLEFFLTFSRFEYALKATGFLVRHPEDRPRQPPAEPDWDCYAVSLRAQFSSTASAALQGACQHMQDSPPNRQVLLNGSPAWETQARDPHVPEIDFLLRMVRCVRNNLFHGAKHNVDVHESTDRTERLLRDCLTILAACLAISPNQERAYADAVL